MQKAAQVLLNALGSPEGELSVLLLDDAAIAELNQQYLDRQGPTNVIAFPMQEGEFSEINPGLLGDVVISLDTAEREAEAIGANIAERFKELLIHGVLHLFGYDHETDRDEARRMEEKTEALLAEIEPIGMEITKAG